MRNSDKKLKRKIGALIVLGLFLAITLAIPTSGWVTNPDGWSLNQQGSNSIEAVYVDGSSQVGIYDTTPDATLEIVDTGSTPFMISSTASGDGDFLLMDTSGRLGIGDTSPDFKLEVTGTSGNGYFGVTSSSDGDIFIIDDEGRVGIGIANPSSALEIKTGYYTSATSALHVKNSQDTSLFFVRDDGNVGIGVIDPAEKLEIDGNVLLNFGSNREIKIEDPPSQTTSDGKDLTVRAGNANLQYGGITDQDGGDLYLYGGDGEGVQTTYGGDVYIYGGIGHSMWAHDGDVILAYTSSMGPRGKVGIGTASPNEKLEVDGKIRANTCFNVGGTDGISQVITIEGASYTHYLTFSGGILVDYSSD